MLRRDNSSRIVLLLFAVLAVVLTALPVMAQDSLLVSYQGYLTDDQGDPVNGTESMTFTIYDTGGVSKWTETQPTVQINEGYFTAILGSETAMPDSVFNGEDRYLGIAVGGDPEISPRTPFTSVASAAYTKKVEGDITVGDRELSFYDPTGSFPDDPSMKMGLEPSPFIEMTEQSLGFGDRPLMKMGVEPSPWHRGYLSFKYPDFDPSPSLFDFGVVNDGSEWSSGIDMYLVHPPEYPDPAHILSIGSAPSTGASFRMFNPQPEPAAVLFELNADAATGPSMSFFDEAGKVMGIEPSPWNEGFSMRLIDPGDGENRLKFITDFLTDETKINFIAPGDDDNPAIELKTDPDGSSFLMQRYDVNTMTYYDGFTMDLDGIDEVSDFRLIAPGNDDRPGFEIMADGLLNTASFRMLDPTNDQQSIIEMYGGSSGANIRMVHPPEKDFMTFSSIPSSGASIKMFNPDPNPAARIMEMGVVTDGPEWSSGIDMYLAHPPEYPTPKQILSIGSAPSTGASFRMFNPQPEPPAMIMELWSGEESSEWSTGFKTYNPLGTYPTTTEIELISTETGNNFKLGNISGDMGTSGIAMTADGSAATMLIANGPGAPLSVISMITNLSSARIGIGNETPTEPLVVGNNLGTFGGKRIIIGDATAGTESGIVMGEDNDNRGWILWNVDNDYLGMGTRETGGVYSATLVLNSGEVGIGTDSPNYTLDVRGTIGNNNTLYHSDRRWKRDIRHLDGALTNVMNLQGVRYKWKRDDYPDMNFPDGGQIGLIAQDVEKVIPEVVQESEDGYKSIDYAKLVSVLIESIKDQQKQIDALTQRIEELEGTQVSGR